MFQVGEDVTFHGPFQAGGEWLATVVQDMFNDTYLIRFRDATMKLVHERDLDHWDGPFHEDDDLDKLLDCG